MSRKYRAEKTICISGSTEIELKMVVTYTVHPGCKQTLVSPAEEATAEVDRVQFFEIKGGKPAPDECGMAPWLLDRLTDGEAFYNWLLSEASEQEEYARDCAAEARAEDMRMRGAE